jgi:hypothetical protein
MANVSCEIVFNRFGDMGAVNEKQPADLGDEEAISSLAGADTAMVQGFVGLINTFNPE